MNLKSMTQGEIAVVLKDLGQPAFRAKQVYTWLHKGVRSYEEMTNLPKALRETLAEHHPINAAPVVIENRIPLVLVYANNDRSVPYERNGALLEMAYSRTDVPHRILCRPTDGHHPHGMPDPMDIVEFILANV